MAFPAGISRRTASWAGMPSRKTDRQKPIATFFRGSCPISIIGSFLWVIRYTVHTGYVYLFYLILWQCKWHNLYNNNKKGRRTPPCCTISRDFPHGSSCGSFTQATAATSVLQQFTCAWSEITVRGGQTGSGIGIYLQLICKYVLFNFAEK